MTPKPLYAVALTCFALSLQTPAWLWGGLWWILLWPATSALWVGFCYQSWGPKGFGKQPCGTLPTHTLLLLAPWFFLQYSLWLLEGIFQREPSFHLVGEGIYVGRRPRPGTLPDDVGFVVDLTCEFPGIALPRDVSYYCLPTLDATAPNPKPLANLLQTLEQARKKRLRTTSRRTSIFVHCASGHGRSATFVAARMLHHKQVPTVDAAEAMLQKTRPGIRINTAQKAMLHTHFPNNTSP